MNDENRRAGAADLLAALHPSDPLPPFVRASGASYFTADGREFVDLNEMRVVLGQENEAFIRALTDALHSVTAPKNTRFPAKEQLLSLLDEATNGAFAAIHLTSSGSEAVESAVRLARKNLSFLVYVWKAPEKGRLWRACARGRVSAVPGLPVMPDEARGRLRLCVSGDGLPNL